jgi:hypothetical protein
MPAESSREGAPRCTAVSSYGNLPVQSYWVKNMLLNPALVLGLILLTAGVTACTHSGTRQDPRPELSRPAAGSLASGHTCRDDADCNDGLHRKSLRTEYLHNFATLGLRMAGRVDLAGQ